MKLRKTLYRNGRSVITPDGTDFWRRLGVTMLVIMASDFCIPTSTAQVPELINSQGRLVEGGGVVNGEREIVIRLMDAATAGNQIYAETQTVSVVDGLYNFCIGASNAIEGALSSALATDGVWLETAVDGTTLSPRERIESVGYAQIAAGVTPGSIVSSSLADGTSLSEISNNDGSGSGLDADLLDGEDSSAFADATHDHDSAELISGTLDITRIPVGSTTSTVAAGNHTHAGGGIDSNAFWQTEGNTGTTAGTHFLGTTDEVPLELHVNGLRVLRIEDDDLAGFPAPRMIGGSASNSIVGFSAGAVIAGGINNHIGTSVFSSVGGGRNNNVADGSDGATIAGGASNGIGANAQYPTVGGGLGNKVADFSFYATIPGGQNNDIGVNSSFSAVGGGGNNNVAGNSNGATIGGGEDNNVGDTSSHSSIGGGSQNSIADNSQNATIAGGVLNDVGTNSNHSSVGGGLNNDVSDNNVAATIVGGADSDIGTNSNYSTIAGGRENAVGPNADYAFAAGRRAKANHQGAFVWADSNELDFSSDWENQFLVRAAGGIRMYSNQFGTMGVQLVPNTTAWTSSSDRNAKENIRPIDTSLILQHLADMPITRWNYIDDPNQRDYIGPMAQDFHAAFDLGEETSINTMDTDGVALAAIQELTQRNDELNRRVAELEALVRQLGVPQIRTDDLEL